MNPSAVPHFAPGMKLRHDQARDRWTVMGPERMFLPDETALEVLRLVDGSRSVEGIIDNLAARFAAPREEIGADVVAMLADLATRGVVRA